VAKSVRQLVAADNNRDLPKVLSSYTEDVVWLPPSGEALVGKDAIRPRYEQMFSKFRVKMAPEVVETGADGNLGFVRGFIKGTLTPLTTGDPVQVDDKFIALTRCEEGVWRVSHLMWNPRAGPR